MMESKLQPRNYWGVIQLIFCLLFAPALWAAGDLLTVASVINGKSFTVSTGDKVRLASIEAPNIQEENTQDHKGRPGEPLGNEAKQALSSLIMDKRVRIDYNPGKRDRHNRLLGQVYDEKGIWIQGEMLRLGFAMVYSFNDDSHDIIVKMLAKEREARKAKRGLWGDPYYRILAPEETREFINRFKLVEGKVMSVHEYHGHMYLNFNEHWKGNFAVFISRKNIGNFSTAQLNALNGKKVTVRGWINYHNAPMIDISRPEQIEIE